MALSVSRTGDTLVVRLGQQLVVGNRQELKRAVLDHLDHGVRVIRVDFGGTAAIDSSGLGLLVSLAKRLREDGVQLRLADVNGEVRTLFRQTMIDSLFDFDESGEP